MRKAFLSFVFCLLSLSFVALSSRGEEWGFSYSGQLLEIRDGVREVADDGSGNTSYCTNFYVRLYDDAEGVSTATNALWGRLIYDVPVKNGNFAFELRDSNGAPLTDAAWPSLQDAFAHLSGDRMTIGIRPFTDAETSEIEPRQQFVAVPYAVFAGDARGARGDLRLDGTLTTVGMAVPEAEFRQSVTHTGPVSFNESPVLPTLSLKAGVPFQAGTVATTNVLKTATLETDVLVAHNATVTLRGAAALVVTNLMVKGTVNAPTLTASDGREMSVEKVEGVSELRAAKIEFDGPVNLFDFANEVKTVKKSISGGEAWSWKDAGGTCSWTVPFVSGRTHNFFVSLSLCLTPGQAPKSASPVTVKVAGKAIAELAVTGVQGNTWLPVSAFVKSGEVVEWSGGSGWSDSTVLLTCREARY